MLCFQASGLLISLLISFSRIFECEIQNAFDKIPIRGTHILMLFFLNFEFV